MYHAVHERGIAVEGSDPHYAVTPGQFKAHLDMMGTIGLRASSVRDLVACTADSATPRAALTFDDGHDTNLAAAELIARRGGSADFFVNPSAVGQGRFLSWSALRDMSALGMSIQSHGQHHRYLNELTPEEVREELVRSKSEIEDRLGTPVVVFAPPGGRTTPELPAIARDVGYRALCTSRTGLWRALDQPWDIPRMAVLASTSDQRLMSWLRQDRLAMWHSALRTTALSAMKRALGNGRYERLRAAALGRGAPPT